MAHVEGKVTSYEVINAALDKPELIATSNAQSAARGMWLLLCERPNDVPVGHAMWKMLQKLPPEMLKALPSQVTAQFTKFENAATVSRSSLVMMSTPRAGKDNLVKTFQDNLEAAKNPGISNKPRQGQ